MKNQNSDYSNSEIQTNQFINFIQIISRSKDDPEFPRIHGGHTDTVSCKSGGKRGPEMIVRIQGEVTLRSCPYSQSKGSNSEGNYQLVEFVACSPSQVQNPTFLSTIHHRSSLPFLIRSSRFIQIQMENWAMAGSVRRRMERGIQFSCLQTVSD